MGFFKYLFAKNDRDIVRVRRLRSGDESGESSDRKVSLESVRVHVALTVNYTMAFILVGSFCALVGFGVLAPDREPPSILRDLLMAVLGYFGGAFVHFCKRG